MPLINRSVVKSDWLNIAAIDNSRDALLDRLISYVDSEIREICQQPIAAENMTFTFEGNLSATYFSGFTVPVTLTSLSSRKSLADPFSAVSGSFQVLNKDGARLLWLDGGFMDLEYQAVASVGFASVPSIVEICAAEMVVELYHSTPFAPQTSRFGISALTESEGGISIGKTLVRMRDRTKQRLAPYIRVSI